MAYNFPPSARFMQSTSIDATSTGITNLYTTDVAGNFLSFFIIVNVDSASSVSSVPTITLGTTAGSNIDVLGSTTLTGLNATGLFSHYAVNSPTSVISPGTSINLNVTTAAVATTYKMNITVVGIYHYP